MTKLKRLKASKGKRWAKGQSSSSNPELKKYREAAKRGFFKPGNVDSATHKSRNQLTMESLHKHNAAVGAEDRMEDEDGLSVGGESAAETFATNYTNCTNVSFSRLLKGFQPDSALHKEMLAILAALAEVIKANGGKETETEYFGALMTTLEGAQTEESIGAVLSLLNMCIKRVPPTILKLKFGDISKSLVTVLERFADSDNNVLLKSTLGCLSVILRVQEPALWSNASTIRVFDIILSFTMHAKPKIRKAAQHAVCAILRGSTIVAAGQKPTSLHPVAGHTGKWFQEEIDKRKDEKGPAFLHLLVLLKDVIGVLPQSQVQDLVQKMLTVNFLGDALTATCAMQVLHGMLVSRPKQESLSAELNAKIVSALYNCKPEINDVQRLLAWLAVITEAVLNLARLDSLFSVSHLPRYFSEVCQLLMTHREEAMVSITQALQNVLSGPLSLAIGAANATGGSDQLKKSLEKVAGMVESCLELQYIKAWKFVIILSTSLIDAVGQIHPAALTSLLQSMADLRASPHFSHTSECDYVFGRAVRVMGPKAVMEAVPLQITGKEETYEFPRSWLLPVLRDNVSHTELAYFQKTLLPIASNCRIRAKVCENLKDVIGTKSFDLIQRQIWSTLPGFCDSPTDVSTSLKDLAPLIGNSIVERPDIRLDCLSAVRNLVSTCTKPSDRAELARFAPNYLPRLFNLYTKKPDGQTTDGHRIAAYETIAVYATVAEEEKLRSFNAKLLEKMASAAEGQAPSGEDPVFLLHSLIDLEQILVVYQDMAGIQKIYAACFSWLSAPKPDVQLQKRAFRIFEVLLSAETKECRKFVQERGEDILGVLTKPLPKGSPPSVAAIRLRCMSKIVQRLDPSAQDVFQLALQEALINLKSSGDKARSAAFALVAEIGKALQRWSEGDEEKALRDFLQILLPGLAASTQQVVATLHALTYLVHEFSEIFPQDLVLLLAENCSLLMQSQTRETVLASLGLAKTIAASFGLKKLAQTLKFFVTGMSKMTEDCRRIYRVKTRELMERLIRKCGPELMAPLLPANDDGLVKRFHVLRKELERKKRQKQAEKGESKESKSDDEEFVPHARSKTIEEILGEDQESDLEDGKEESGKTKKSARRKQTAGTWIAEESDEIVDFLDPSAVQNVTVTKPADPNAKPKKDLFKTTADGKLLIVDDGDDKSSSDDDYSDDEAAGRKMVKAQSVKSFRSTSTLDIAQTANALAGLKVGKKRRLDSDQDDTASTATMKYKAGGSGIHRQFEKVPPKRQKTGSKDDKKPQTPKGKGDAKKGKYDPYAYLPLDKGSLNKRKKAKFAGQFSSVVSSAKKGAAIGKKKSAQAKRT